MCREKERVCCCFPFGNGKLNWFRAVLSYLPHFLFMMGTTERRESFSPTSKVLSFSEGLKLSPPFVSCCLQSEVSKEFNSTHYTHNLKVPRITFFVELERNETNGEEKEREV